MNSASAMSLGGPTINESNIYVNTHGNDSWDGLSPVYNNTTRSGPKLTVENATGTVSSDGTVHIAPGTYTENGITLSNSMTIIGNTQQNTIINGNNSGTIFFIEPGLNVSIINLTLTQGQNSYNDGGAINNQGTLTITNSTLNNNLAASGGAIYNQGTLTVSNSKFTNNTANHFGGAMYGDGAYTVTNCTFNNNQALSDGGAIYSYYGELTINRSNFTGNIAHGLGGAIVSCNYINLTNSTLNGNSAVGYSGTYGWGGAIFIQRGTAYINYNRITENHALTGNALYFDSSIGGTVNAENNWWGYNNNPNTIPNLIATNNVSVDADPWVILTINATPTSIKNGQTSTVTANLNHINGGGLLVGGQIPDGQITLSTPWGSFTKPSISHSITENTTNSVMTSTFYAIEGSVNPAYNPVEITATADNYTTNNTESAYITIQKITDLYMKITSNNNNPKTNETIILTYELGNNGPDIAQNIIITIPLPKNFEVLNITGDGTWTISNNTVTWTMNTVPVGDPNIYIAGKFNQAGTYALVSSISTTKLQLNVQDPTPTPTSNTKNNTTFTFNSETKTIPMQHTGLPVAGLILGILSVIGGSILPKRK